MASDFTLSSWLSSFFSISLTRREIADIDTIVTSYENRKVEERRKQVKRYLGHQD